MTFNYQYKEKKIKTNNFRRKLSFSFLTVSCSISCNRHYRSIVN